MGDCNDASISCRLDQIVDTLNAAPSVWEVLGTIVVPLVLGIATIFIAIASLRISQRTHDLGVAVAERDAAMVARAERRSAADELIRWATTRFTVDNVDVERTEGPLTFKQQRDTIIVKLMASGKPDYVLLGQTVEYMDERATKHSDKLARIIAHGWTLAVLHGQIEIWVADPSRLDSEQVKEMVETFESEKLPELLQQARESVREAVQRHYSDFRRPASWLSRLLARLGRWMRPKRRRRAQSARPRRSTQLR